MHLAQIIYTRSDYIANLASDQSEEKSKTVSLTPSSSSIPKIEYDALDSAIDSATNKATDPEAKDDYTEQVEEEKEEQRDEEEVEPQTQSQSEFVLTIKDAKDLEFMASKDEWLNGQLFHRIPL